jgi:hypothetical protein
MLEQIFVVGSIMLDCACGERHSASGFFFCFWLPGVAIIRVLYGVFLCFIACSSLCLCLSLTHTHTQTFSNASSWLCRLENRVSILDLRVECQDLEKFSVINRFAKFHGRGQVDGAEASSSSETTANTQKSFPQRYVTALPMPRNLPDRVQCLSLWSLINWFFSSFSVNCLHIPGASMVHFLSTYIMVTCSETIEPQGWECRRRMDSRMSP